MPNWCEGDLKIRGNFKNVAQWCRENINIYGFSLDNGSYLDKNNPAKIEVSENEEEIKIIVPKTAYIEHTKRNFIEEGTYWGFEYDGIIRLVLHIKAAWDFESKPYVEMSQKFGIDFSFYGFERGAEFNREVIIENGELKVNNDITYDDYFWECPCPDLGG